MWLERDEKRIGRVGVVVKHDDKTFATRLQRDYAPGDDEPAQWEVELVGGVEPNYVRWRPSGYELAILHPVNPKGAGANREGRPDQAVIVQVAPAWCQPLGRFPRAHAITDHIVVRTLVNPTVMQVAAHTLTPCILPQDTPMRAKIGRAWRTCVMVQDFVGTDTRVLDRNVFDPLLLLRRDDTGERLLCACLVHQIAGR